MILNLSLVSFVHCHFRPWAAFLPQSPLLDLGWHGSHVEDPRGWQHAVSDDIDQLSRTGWGWLGSATQQLCRIPFSSTVDSNAIWLWGCWECIRRVLGIQVKKCPCHLFLVAYDTSAWPSTISMAWWRGTFHPLEMSLVLRRPYIRALSQSLLPEMTTAPREVDSTNCDSVYSMEILCICLTPWPSALCRVLVPLTVQELGMEADKNMTWWHDSYIKIVPNIVFSACVRIQTQKETPATFYIFRIILI